MTFEDLKAFFSDGVSVVGNAQSILHQKPMGKDIDSRPTIRFNWIELKNTEYTGSRKDCICTGIPQKLRDTQYKILIGRTHDSRFEYFQYPPDLSKTLRKKLDKKPSNGIKILYLLDHMKIKNVHIYGFDWKKSVSLVEKNRISKPETEHHDYKKEKELSLELIQKNNWNLHQ